MGAHSEGVRQDIVMASVRFEVKKLDREFRTNFVGRGRWCVTEIKLWQFT